MVVCQEENFLLLEFLTWGGLAGDRKGWQGVERVEKQGLL